MSAPASLIFEKWTGNSFMNCLGLRLKEPIAEALLHLNHGRHPSHSFYTERTHADPSQGGNIHADNKFKSSCEKLKLGNYSPHH